jgi:hypothetical protein
MKKVRAMSSVVDIVDGRAANRKRSGSGLPLAPCKDQHGLLGGHRTAERGHELGQLCAGDALRINKDTVTVEDEESHGSAERVMALLRRPESQAHSLTVL